MHDSDTGGEVWVSESEAAGVVFQPKLAHEARDGPAAVTSENFEGCARAAVAVQ